MNELSSRANWNLRIHTVVAVVSGEPICTAPRLCRGVRSAPTRERGDRGSPDENGAVSEIVGVVMLLAMLITVMSGVVFLIEPYLSDFEDQRDWAATHVIAEQVADRLDVIGAAPEGTGAKMGLELRKTRFHILDDVETWTLQADLTVDERVELDMDRNVISVSCQNSTCAQAVMWDGGVQNSWQLLGDDSIQELNTSGIPGDIIIIDILDADGEGLHRFVQMRLTGLELITQLNTGDLEVAMINGAMMERLPGRAWSIEEFPTLRFDELPDGTPRMSMMLTQLTASEHMPSGVNPVMEFNSGGALNLFDGEVWNFRFEMVNDLHDIINPQYINHWTAGHEIHVATDTLDEYSGIAPFRRQSGADGLTVIPAHSFILEVGLQQIEVGA